MNTIFKYTLEPMRKQYIKMPAGARILSVQGQHDKVAIWALVETGINEIRCFTTYITGAELPADPGTYIGTAQLHNGATVIHVFEEK